MTLTFNAFKDPCPGLTKKQAQFCKGFGYEAIERRKAAGLWPSMPSRTLALGSPEAGSVLQGIWLRGHREAQGGMTVDLVKKVLSSPSLCRRSRVQERSGSEL